MAKIDIDLKSEYINNAVAQAILDSFIGGNFKQIVIKHISDALGNSWNSPVKDIINDAIKKVIKDELESEQNKNRMKKILDETLTDSLISEVIKKAISKITF